MADLHQINETTSDAEEKEVEKEVEKEMGASDKPNNSRRYNSDDVADIIRISLQNESGSSPGTIDYEELVSIGKDVGVEPDQIDRAVELLAEERQAKDKEHFLWVRFKAHCLIFAMVNILCVGINILVGLDSFWSGYVLFGWGLFLMGHYAGLRYAPEVLQMALDRTKLLASNKYHSYVEDDVNVSFTIADSSGLMESQGLAFTKDDELIVEYQNVDSMLGLLKTGVKEISIKFDDIALAKVEPKLWGSELVLKGRSLKTFRRVPGSKSGVLHLKLSRQSSNAAQNLVNEITENQKRDS